MFIRGDTPFSVSVEELWADSVSPRINTIVSRDRVKPIKIGENLVVNYKYGLLTKCEVKMAEYWPSSFLRVYGPKWSRVP